MREASPLHLFMAESASRAVFLSYASQDAEAARRICESLRSGGVEVWFDADGGLEHGDEWDAKIRRQIKECVLFIPVISANTQARLEGYFRIEWELAAQRALGIASGVPFILPVVIDDTREPDALVPDRFRMVQWTRLRGGEVPAEVRARFLKLWSHRAGVLKNEAAQSAPAPIAALPSAAEAIGKPGVKIYAIIAAAIVILVAGVGWWLLGGRGESPAPPVPPPAGAPLANAPKPAAPAVTSSVAPTPARELAEKARGLFQALEATREDFELAEDYCQRALKLDSGDGEVWATYSQLNSAFGYRGWDTSPERREQTRVMAERAIRLAPMSVEAKLAQAGAWAAFGVNRPETEKLLREVVQERPRDQVALRFLAVTVLNRGGLDECLALNERSAALPGGDPLALYNSARYLWQRNRQAEAYTTLQRSLAQKPFSSSLVLKMLLEIMWRGDLAAAEAALQQIPQSAQLEDRANYSAGLVRFYQRRAGAALEAWGAFPRDYYNDFQYDGPKGLLIGLADELDHREAAARIEWRTALQAVEKRIAATPNNSVPYYYKAYLLACLGEKVAAEETLHTFEQLAGANYTNEKRMPIEGALIYARLGRFDDIFAHFPDYNVARLRIDPRFEALRADPRFEAALAKSPSPPAAKK